MTETETFVAGDDFVVPVGVSTVEVELEAEGGYWNQFGNGASDTPPHGGRVAGTLEVTPGDTLYIRSSPGGDGSGDGGGDSIDIRVDGTSLDDRVVVAAGAGGDGSDSSTTGWAVGHGGDGGADTGADGSGGSSSTGGGGGTQSEGGESDNEDGSFGPGGGSGGLEEGGGGAGWYGGGEGGSGSGGGGGGGGSNHTDGLTTVDANERGTSSRSVGDGGLVTIEYLQPPQEAENVTAERIGDTDDVEVTWTGDVASGEYRLYRDHEGDVDETSTLVATVASGTSHSVTDTPTFGGRYRYGVIAWDEENGISSSVESNEVTVPIAAPSDLSVDDVRDAEADLSWTDNAHNEAGYRVDVREDDNGAWEAAVDGLAADTTSTTVMELLNGQLYGGRVVAVGLGLEIADIDPDVLPGETLTIASGETVEFEKPHVNQGTVSNAGTMQPDDI